MKISAVIGLAPHEGHYGSALPFFDSALHRIFHLFSALRHFGFETEIFCHRSLGADLTNYSTSSKMINICDTINEDQVLSGSPKFLFVWNGASEHWLTDAANATETRVVYSELGWLPQHNTIALDFSGAGPLSSFVNDTNTPEVEASPEYEAWRALYCSSQIFTRPEMIHTRPDETIFVPLQMESDSNMNFSPFRRMSDFVDRVSETFRDFRIVVRPHPHQRDVDLRTLPDNVIVTGEGSLAYWFQNSRATIGLNSTVLIEALTWRTRTISLAQNVGWNKNAFVYEGNFDGAKLRAAVEIKPRENSIDTFLQELVFRRQISMKSLYSRRSIFNNSVLGCLLNEIP